MKQSLIKQYNISYTIKGDKPSSPILTSEVGDTDFEHIEQNFWELCKWIYQPSFKNSPMLEELPLLQLE